MNGLGPYGRLMRGGHCPSPLDTVRPTSSGGLVITDDKMLDAAGSHRWNSAPEGAFYEKEPTNRGQISALVTVPYAPLACFRSDWTSDKPKVRFGTAEGVKSFAQLELASNLSVISGSN